MKDKKIKKDGNFILYYSPRTYVVENLEEGHYWINDEGERVYNSLTVFLIEYENGDKLDEPKSIRPEVFKNE